MKLSIPSSVTRQVARQVLLGRKHSPTILFGAGIVGMVATTVTACRATLKVEALIDETQGKLELTRTVTHPNYSDKDRQKDKLYIYIQAASKFTRLYGPSLILGMLSVAALTKSHNILNTRNASLTAAYAAVDKAFKQYRERVVTEFGEDKDRELQHGSETHTVVFEDKNGPKKKEVKTHNGKASQYAQFFDEYNQNWAQQPEYNLAFLRCQQNWANDRLQSHGYLFLNDVYDALGLERTKAGQIVGWIWDPNNTGVDSRVDFGIWSDKSMQRFHDFVTGRENTILLDFNVDGNVLDKF